MTLTRPRLPAAGSPAHALCLLGGLLLASLAALLLACRLGSVPLSSAELWAALRTAE